MTMSMLFLNPVSQVRILLGAPNVGWLCASCLQTRRHSGRGFIDWCAVVASRRSKPPQGTSE